MNPGLSLLDDRGALRPVLAETVPTLENGLWKLFPDGRMETTWKLKPGLKWHDGTAFTSEDFVFAYRVFKDPAWPNAIPSAIGFMAEAILRGLNMSVGERKERWVAMMKVLERNDITAWRERFVRALSAIDTRR